MKISPARKAAFDALMRIERDGEFSSAVLPLVEIGLSEVDRRLCHELVLGTLRRKLYLDKLIELISNGRRVDLEISIALRIGLYQLIFLDRVPAHSAINESVELAVRAKKTSAKGFVNAVLRSFLRERPVPNYLDQIEKISVEESHPRQLVEQWIDQFGFETATAICRANNETPGVAFRVVKDIDSIKDRLSQNPQILRSEFVPNCYLAAESTPQLRDLAENGQIYFQDEGSQLVARSVIACAGKSVLDVCAAPGGKAAMIAGQSEAAVIAGDVSFTRLTRLRETSKNLDASVAIVQLSGESVLPFESGSFDTVFVDAPCSGTGTIRHNPEIRYSFKEDELADLSAKQLRILRNASELVAPGGTLIYSTCSLENKENEMVADAFQKSDIGFKIESPAVPERFMTSGGYARTFPHRDKMDGFYIAVFRRI